MTQMHPTPTTTDTKTVVDSAFGAVDIPREQHEALFRRIAIYFGELNPTGTLSFSYATEGAANTIWLVHFHDSNLSKHDSTVVLRLRKDLPSTIPMTDLKSQFEERIAPLFDFDPSLLLPVHLIQINQGLVDTLNQDLLNLERINIRRAMRCNVYHPDLVTEPFAMIMPNLAHGSGKVIEFKPKWLVQSPSAPRSAQRCRTCALNASRRAKGKSGRGDGGFCPFDLLSSHQSILTEALSQIWTDPETMPGFLNAFKGKVQPALRQMQRLQRVHGQVGLNDFLEPQDKDFGVAMALRDCSMLLKVVPSRSTDGDTCSISTVKLLDLDPKDTGGGKLEKWREMERELIDDGWYTARTDADVKCAMSFQ